MSIEQIISTYQTLSQIHNSVEQRVLSTIHLGQSAMDLRIQIEELIEEHCRIYRNNTTTAGIAFPVGLNRNHCVAHWSPTTTSGQWTIERDDVIKIDFGVQIGGHILDAAFTVAFDSKYRDLLEASRNACMVGASTFGNNRPIYSVSKAVYNTIPKSFGVIQTLCGHQIKPFEIHAGKVVPNHLFDAQQRAYAGEIYTVEPFVSTNTKPQTFEDTSPKEQSHFMYNYREYGQMFDILLPTLRLIPELPTYRTFAFHLDWLMKNKSTEEKDRSSMFLSNFVKKNIYKPYPPIYEHDTKSKVAQFETTVLVTADKPILWKEYPSVEPYIINNSP